ncbi:protein-glutamine gamma-glutamyltransferase 2 [Mugil cephalus]|uniref:protein-glutamine gamma-glutamyltransferase 2 n=1 Tax=Mugil cephalus TaxID=48193 RepID=UPI001FB78DF5|nr:protein-glutamine gamma-glutamyltransferase 2 [Mugil cephalus]
MTSIGGLITGVDVRSRENNANHRTKEIDGQRLIVRRGQPFYITVQCSLPFGHELEVVLHLGKSEDVVIKAQRGYGDRDKWWFYQEGAHDAMLLTVHSPADAIVGKYRLAVLVTAPDGRIVDKVDNTWFHVLFNPWCRDDVVYLPDDALLREYVMNEDGIIYRGSWDYIGSIPWNYGQFEDNVMDICFEVLDNSKDALRNSKMDIERRSDPVYVSRIITAMVNANGDRGVVAGRWQEPYADGIAPYRWTGSVPILRQWSKYGAKAVKYGQCWVFAGVACTVLRCLGIPTRFITNFNSAHDVDGNLSLDYILDESGDSRDSSWNFHCWVESWMRREDLPKGNDGWQVLDPTPQELSEGEFCCGPCPVTAIKEGNLAIKYDATFIFAEVNADTVYWAIGPDGQRHKVRVDQSSVGRNISTKSAHGDFREDVTLHYKYPEGSQKEREVFMKAGRPVTEPDNGITEPEQLQLSIQHNKPVFGTDFDVVIEVKNEGGKDAHAQLTILAMGVTYNSAHHGECKKQTFTLTVPAFQSHREVMRMHYDDYARCISDLNVVRVRALLETPRQNTPVMALANIPLSMPEVKISVLGKAVVREELAVRITLVNPLPVPLKGGVFTVEGAGLLSPNQIVVAGVIDPGQKVTVKFSFTPRRSGVKKLVVDFDSNRLKDVKGVTTVVVNKRCKPVFPGYTVCY